MKPFKSSQLFITWSIKINKVFRKLDKWKKYKNRNMKQSAVLHNIVQLLNCVAIILSLMHSYAKPQLDT